VWIAQARNLRLSTGTFSGIRKYKVGALNDPMVIYPVHGGMEDWAYGASWSAPNLLLLYYSQAQS